MSHTPVQHEHDRTSESEMIRKAPLSEFQIALGKQKISSVECMYLSHSQNSAKNSFPTQNFTEIEQSAAE